MRRSQLMMVPRLQRLRGAACQSLSTIISPVHSYLDAFPRRSFLHLASIEEFATPSSLSVYEVVAHPQCSRRIIGITITRKMLAQSELLLGVGPVRNSTFAISTPRNHARAHLPQASYDQ